MSINGDKIKEFFKTKLKESGHSLENDVETKREKYFTVEREKLYLDKDEGKGRSFDIIAYSFFPEADKITNNLVIYSVETVSFENKSIVP